jgi:hypothetical protein
VLPTLRIATVVVAVSVPLIACGLSVGGPVGPAPDGGPDAGKDDRTTGQTPTGALCTCLKSAPMGWTYVVLNADDQVASCPAEYANKKPHVDGLIDSPAMCSCPTCTVDDPGTCAYGAFSFRGGVTNACTDTMSSTPTQTAGCFNITNWDSPNSGTTYAGGSVAGTTMAAGSCTGTPQVDLPAAAQRKGATCALGGPLGSVCSAGFDCVPDAPSPFLVCIGSSSPGVCPAEYPVKHDIGDAINDGRGCGPCTCATTTDCTQGTMDLFSDDNCSNSLGTPMLPVGANTCTSTATNNIHIHSVKVTQTPKATCAASGSKPSGTVALLNPHTVCCQK